MVADQYYSAIKNQDYARAYSYLGSLLKKAFSSGGFALEAQENEAAFGKVSHFTYAATASGEPETAIMTVTRTKGRPYPVHLELRQEGGVWKVTAFDRI
jgi:hypothetical protein